MNATPGLSTSPGSSWDFGDRKEDPIHRIHAYPAKFPAFITTKALQYATQRGVNVGMVADVFCGCGTTAVEARRNGKNFWGCDINPVATLIARVKTRHYRDSVLERYFATIRESLQDAEPACEHHARIPTRLSYWFDDSKIHDLLRLREAIRRTTPRNSPYRQFFLCAFSNILKPTSQWLTKSIKPQIDPHKTPRDVMEAFHEQVALMRKANEQNSCEGPSPSVCIKTRNFLAPAVPKLRPDLIVTSPPYVTSYNYADIHQLSTLWLGYASDYRSVRKHMVGNEYDVRRLSRTAIDDLGTVATETCERLSRRDKRKSRSVARYFFDMNKAVAKCGSMLSDNGMVVFVIGNTRYQGVRIDNERHLVSCMERAGFQDVETVQRKISLKTMTPYRDARGRFTRDATQRKVYNNEFVIIGRRR